VRQVATALAIEDWIGLIGVVLITAFVGNRFGLDAAVGFVGIVLVAVALLIAITRSTPP